VLRPVYLQSRVLGGSINERLDFARDEIKKRTESLAAKTEEVAKEVEADWGPRKACEIAPGARILDLAFREFGVGFDKDKGDSARLARYMPKPEIHYDLQTLLQEITADRLNM
jgi:hypothetical protein